MVRNKDLIKKNKKNKKIKKNRRIHKMNEKKKTCLITGCSTGIGKATAIELAKMNYYIIMLVRDSEKSRKAFEEIKSASMSNAVKIFYVDLSSQDSIRKVVKEIEKEYSQIDVLINNAGVSKRKYEISPDGYEMTLAINYLGPFLLTNLLIKLIAKSPEGRIINLTSELYKKGKVKLDNLLEKGKFNGQKSYANSKLLLVYFTQILAQRAKQYGIMVNCVHPGMVATEFIREYPNWLGKIINLFLAKPKDGASPVIYLATSLEIDGITGKYFYKTEEKAIKEETNHEKVLLEIWETSERITKLKNLI
jgi:NAD(P)-dependent dehydrogenase (short-subunit alcohol dehydrogenase family)